MSAASLQKALSIMFAALRKSNSSFDSQPVRPGLIGQVIMKSQFVDDLMLCHWVNSANVLTDFSNPVFKVNQVKQLKTLHIFATAATCPVTQQHNCENLRSHLIVMLGSFCSLQRYSRPTMYSRHRMVTTSAWLVGALPQVP